MTVSPNRIRPAGVDTAITRNRAADLVTNLAVVGLLAKARNAYPRDILKAEFSDDRDLADIVTRTAMTPTSTSTSALVQAAVPSFIAVLGGESAIGPLVGASDQYVFDGGAFINVGTLIADATAASFPGELNPIAVRMLTIGGLSMVPHDLQINLGIFARDVHAQFAQHPAHGSKRDRCQHWTGGRDRDAGRKSGHDGSAAWFAKFDSGDGRAERRSDCA